MAGGRQLSELLAGMAVLFYFVTLVRMGGQ
jgi:hypothetical protein